MSENYVRPPIVALEAPSPRAGVWRYRITITVLLLVIAAGIFLIAKAVVGGGEGNPDVGNGGGTMPVHHAVTIRSN